MYVHDVHVHVHVYIPFLRDERITGCDSFNDAPVINNWLTPTEILENK